ncbi:hypothetical protein RCOM_0662170 [Ricinus communis]|uniref:Uncharacterized protein n=1 Tax=Ricinus communis TaxID=3988 RepID=B9T4G3_RICCO|nr:hypothetical protein RCOM_0662170 [Ricinus communis]
MSGDNFTDEVPKVRAVLGDVTNLPVKRGISLISDDLGLKSRDRNGKKVILEDGNSRFGKQVCLGVEKMVNEKFKTKVGVDSINLEDEQSCESSDTDTDVDAVYTSQENNENKETSNLLDGSVNLVKNATMTLSVGELGDTSRDSCTSTGSMPANFWSSKKGSDDDEGRHVKRSNSTGHVCTSVVEKDLGIGNLARSKCGAVEWSSGQKSHGSRSFELDRCTALQGDGCANLNAGADLLKACSCSFCLKAAYIWSDLHYQDIKGRISESDLTAQWRSLFHHMEDIFAHECNQLQDGFVALKDLRENCKTDLERINEMHSNKTDYKPSKPFSHGYFYSIDQLFCTPLST